MPPKSAVAATKKAPAAAPVHPPFKEMIKEAIANLKDRKGSSRPKLKQYIKSNYKGVENDGFDRHFNAALKKGHESGDFVYPKGPSGTVKLAKKEPPAPKPVSVKKTAVAKKVTASKKASPTTKKANEQKKPAASGTATKKPAAKPKANAKKPRKESINVSAVVDKPTVLTKTKSGRVTKTATTTTKPASKKKAVAVKKKPAPKKAAA